MRQKILINKPVKHDYRAPAKRACPKSKSKSATQSQTKDKSKSKRHTIAECCQRKITKSEGKSSNRRAKREALSSASKTRLRRSGNKPVFLSHRRRRTKISERQSFQRQKKKQIKGKTKNSKGKRQKQSQPNSHFYANPGLANTICNFSLQAVSQVNGSQHSWALSKWAWQAAVSATDRVHIYFIYIFVSKDVDGSRCACVVLKSVCVCFWPKQDGKII